MTTPLLGLVDTAVVGYAGDVSLLAAVALGSSLFNLLFWSFAFLRISTTGLAAQADPNAFAYQFQLLKQALTLAALISGLIFVLLALTYHYLPALLTHSLSWLSDQSLTTTTVVGVQDYLVVRALGAPALLSRYVLIGWFIGQQNTRAPLLLVVTVNLINIIFDLLLVVVWDFGLHGVAIASVMAEYAGLVVGIKLVHRQYQRASGQNNPVAVHISWRALISMNTDIFIRTLILLLVLTFFTYAGAGLGEVVLATNAILFNYVMLLSYGLDSIAHTAEALIAEAARQGRRAFQAVINHTLFWSSIIAGLFTISYALGQSWLPGLLTDQSDILSEAARYWPWVLWFPLIAFWGYWLDGLLIGLNRTRDLRNGMLLSAAGFVLIYAFGSHHAWLAPNDNIWLALWVFTGLRALTLVWLWQRRGWQFTQTPQASG